MRVPDFQRSFLTFTSDDDRKESQTRSHAAPYRFNAARIQLESVCTLTGAGGATHRYVLGASCKSEIVGLDSDLWLHPNADYCPVASDSEILIMKSWITNQTQVMLEPPTLGRQPERQVGLTADLFSEFEIRVVEADGEALDSTERIIEATYAQRPLVARLQYEDAGYRVCIDHPVKTMNVNPRDGVFQTDTGPILLPDFARARDSGLLVSAFELAFAAFNRPAFAEMVIRRPTPVTADGTLTGVGTLSANHYEETRRIDAMDNQVLAL